MRRITKLLPMALACTFAVAGCGTRSDTVHAPKDDGAAAENGIAVVELFTSEGCSSCPPADALLKRLADEARQDKRPVYCLAFHVDYFNRLGWVDKLSDAAYTHRQEWYGGLLDGVEVYTPMMIVNGRSPFLGYDEATAQKYPTWIADSDARSDFTEDSKRTARRGSASGISSGGTRFRRHHYSCCHHRKRHQPEDCGRGERRQTSLARLRRSQFQIRIGRHGWGRLNCIRSVINPWSEAGFDHCLFAERKGRHNQRGGAAIAERYPIAETPAIIHRATNCFSRLSRYRVQTGGGATRSERFS